MSLLHSLLQDAVHAVHIIEGKPDAGQVAANVTPPNYVVPKQPVNISPSALQNGVPGLNGVPAPTNGLVLPGNASGGFQPSGTQVIDGSSFPLSNDYQPMQHLPLLRQYLPPQ